MFLSASGKQPVPLSRSFVSEAQDLSLEIGHLTQLPVCASSPRRHDQLLLLVLLLLHCPPPRQTTR
jgi:hypothetical protein